MKIVLDDGAYMPVRAHETDAGLDLKTPKAVVVMPGKSAKIDTGVHIELPKGTVGMLKSKSGLNVNSNITGEGVIDEGYCGSIVVKLYNHGDKAVVFEPGDKVIQLVILPVIIPDSIELVTKFDETDRGENGFGSTGR